MADILRMITAKRYLDNATRECYYLATYQTDGWLYFNDDKFWRYNQELKTLQIFYISKELWVNSDVLEIENITTLDGNEVQSLINGGGSTAPGGQGVEDAIKWALQIADDESHGYAQDNRWGPDYDCSSFVYEAFRIGGGFNLPVQIGNTQTMINDFTNIGFTWIPNKGNVSSDCKRGDILLNITDHVEIYLGNQQNVGAHINEWGGINNGEEGDQTGDEISITGYYSYPWDGILRYE